VTHWPSLLQYGSPSSINNVRPSSQSSLADGVKYSKFMYGGRVTNGASPRKAIALVFARCSGCLIGKQPSISRKRASE
jgi:hypothetical protein